MENVIFSIAGLSLTYEAVGWIGSMLFAFCALPQAIHAYRHKHSDGMTWTFLLMWLFGELFTLAYISSKQDVLPLLANYILNLIFLFVILWFKFFPKRNLDIAKN